MKHEDFWSKAVKAHIKHDSLEPWIQKTNKTHMNHEDSRANLLKTHMKHDSLKLCTHKKR